MINSFHISVKGFIFHKNKFLFVQKANNGTKNQGFWELPGGGLDFGESPENGLIREIKEETEIDISVKEPIFIWSFKKNSTKQVVGITFLCLASNTLVKLSAEHSGFIWLSKSEFDSLNLLPELKKDMETWNWEFIEKKIKEEMSL